jgi:hypothetical protein
MQPKIIDLRDLDMGRAYEFTQGDQVHKAARLAAGLELADAALVGGAA